MKAIRLTLLALLAIPMLAFGAAETVHIKLSQPGLSIDVTEPRALADFRFGPGPGNFTPSGPAWQPKSWIVEDWEHPADEPSGALVRQQVTFQLRMNDATTREYVVFFVFEPGAGQGYVYLPARGEPFYDSNINLLRRDKYDGHWFRATAEWTSWAQGLADAARQARPNLLAMVPPTRLDEPIEPDTGPVLVKDGVLDLHGRIDSAMRQRLAQALAGGNLTTVRITSHGGEIFEAMLMADMIQKRGIDVAVRDLCTGACAQYIFVAGRHRKLEKDSLVGFMTTYTSSGKVLTMATDLLEVKNPADFMMGQMASLEQDLYRRRGVSAALLLDAHVALQPQCVSVKRESSRMSWNMSSNYFLWVPSRQYLKAAGVEFEGDWPKSHFNLGGLSNRHMKAGSSRWIRYGDNDHLRSKKQRPYRLEDLTHCVLDELPKSPAQ
jgi:hypothetical protein